MIYRRRPVEVEAIQWTGHNATEIAAFLDDEVAINRHNHIVLDSYQAAPYYWIVRHPGGYLTAYSPDGFAETFEEVE